MTRWTPQETGTYWVLGGEYGCTAFRDLRRGPEARGPYRRRADAEAEWRKLSFGSTHEATRRYIVVEEGARPGA